MGTAVVPVHPRHPVALAQQALTVNRVLGGRLALGLGVSHRILVEGSWGLSFDRPVSYLSEYLDALLPLLNERRVSVAGERVSAHSELDIDSPPCPVFIAALGPRMLALAGRTTSGTITWMVGAHTIRDLTAPVINEARGRSRAGRSRGGGGAAVCVTGDSSDARARAAAPFASTASFPPTGRCSTARAWRDPAMCA